MSNSSHEPNEISVWLKWSLVIMLCLSMGFLAGQLYGIGDDDCAQDLVEAVETAEKLNAQGDELVKQNSELSRISGLALERLEACEARCPNPADGGPI